MLVNVTQGSPEWLEMRQSMIGASDAPIIMGESNYNTPYMLWLEKLGMGHPKYVHEAMQEGHRMEPIIRDWANEHLALQCEAATYFHESVPWMMASLDGIDLNNGVVMEIKNTKDTEDAEQGRVPQKHCAQCQHILEVVRSVGINTLYYIARNTENDGNTYIVRVFRDESYVAEMMEQEQAFYECMQSGKEPQKTDRDYIDRDDDLEWAEGVREYVEAMVQEKYWKEQKEFRKKNLVDLSSETPSRGAGATLYKSVRSGSVDYSLIPELQGVDLNLYRKPPGNPYWVVRVK